MKKVFISQPLKDKTYDEIMEERQKAIEAVRLLYHDTIEIVNPFFLDAPFKHPLWILGRNLEFMSEVDVVVFAPGWKNHRNCKIEHVCAMEYNIEAIEL